MTLQKVIDETLDATALQRQHPPALGASKKLNLFAMAPPASGSLHVVKWRGAMGNRLDVKPVQVTVSESAYQYRSGDWYVNFADPHLFGFYESDLFAQDEVMVAEHPILMSVRELLGRQAVCSATTTFTIEGAQRQLAVEGLYGNAFRQSTWAQIARKVHSARTRSSIVTMVAPRGQGSYTADQIDTILTTARTAYHAVKRHAEAPVSLHTGHWGCGAFGGNKELMAILQLVAARDAGIDHLYYHGMGDTGAIRRALTVVEGLGRTQNRVVDEVLGMQFAWGRPNGT